MIAKNTIAPKKPTGRKEQIAMANSKIDWAQISIVMKILSRFILRVFELQFKIQNLLHFLPTHSFIPFYKQIIITSDSVIPNPHTSRK